ncbi:MAG: DUF1559 domain-containing protein, partial [Caulobacteraceae bacterium]|nr:DUF1559 domain-containing protein [Caulobacteraceae bacterium]
MRFPRVRPAVRRMLLCVAVLAPVLLFVRAAHRGREEARRSQCVSNLNWIVFHLELYHQTNGSFPPATLPSPTLPPERRLSWLADLASSGGIAGGTSPGLDRTRGWDQPPNWPPKFPHHAFLFTACPSARPRRGSASSGLLSYVGVAGLGPDAPSLPAGHRRAGVFGDRRTTRLADISDGVAGTLMLVETARDPGPWTAGGPASVRGVDPATRPYLGAGRPFGGIHPAGVEAAMADGSVRLIRETIDPRVFEALSTLA